MNQKSKILASLMIASMAGGVAFAAETVTEDTLPGLIAKDETITAIQKKADDNATAITRAVTTDALPGLIEENATVKTNKSDLVGIKASITGYETRFGRVEDDVKKNGEGIAENQRAIRERVEMDKLLANSLAEAGEAHRKKDSEQDKGIAENKNLATAVKSALVATQDDVFANTEAIAEQGETIAEHTDSIAENQRAIRERVEMDKLLANSLAEAGEAHRKKDSEQDKGIADNKVAIASEKEERMAAEKDMRAVVDKAEATSVKAEATTEKAGKLAQEFKTEIGRIGALDNRINEVGASAAALAALHPLEFQGDETWSVAGGYGHYNGEDAGAVGVFYRPTANAMISVGAAFGGDEEMYNAGVSFRLGQGTSGVSTSNGAMARELRMLQEKDAQRDAQMNRLMEKIQELEEELAAK